MVMLIIRKKRHMCLKNKIIVHLNKNSREEKSNDRSQWWQIVKESAAGKVLSVEERNGRRFWGGAVRSMVQAVDSGGPAHRASLWGLCFVS